MVEVDRKVVELDSSEDAGRRGSRNLTDANLLLARAANYTASTLLPVPVTATHAPVSATALFAMARTCFETP